jgi:SAM-dependent methyltransferase
MGETNHSAVDRVFAGSIPQVYERYLVPLIFEPYAMDIAVRVARRTPNRVLEIAAGTGVVTRQLGKMLPSNVAIVATDLNQPMLDHAKVSNTVRGVEWRTADAMQLPFADESFDVIVCQFGAMFFQDKPKGFSEARRVLRPSGLFVFNVWDRIEQNEFAEAVTRALESLFPDDPPRFLARIPHGYHDVLVIAADLARGGFDRVPEITTLTERSRAKSPSVPAVAYCQGTPLRTEIEARDTSLLAKATDLAAEAIATDSALAK